MTVAVLFARADSHYKALPGVEVYDMERDARTYDGPHPVVAHPPCRSWGAFAMFAKPRADERNLARLAVALVREFGGVLEHPLSSKLWPAQKLPAGYQRDQYGGWTLVIDQHWWGHRADRLLGTVRRAGKPAHGGELLPGPRPRRAPEQARHLQRRGLEQDQARRAERGLDQGHRGTGRVFQRLRALRVRAR